MNPLINIDEFRDIYTQLSIVTVLSRIDYIENLIKQYDRFIGDNVEFIVFCKELNDMVVVSHFRRGCKHRIFVKNYDDYDRKDKEYLMNFGGGRCVLFLEEDEEIDKNNLNSLLSVIVEKRMPKYFKDGEVKVIYRVPSKER